jgi:gliding motility-associated-like protein
MRKHILLFAFALFFQLTIAQNNCQNALPFCAGGVSGVTFPATTSTPQIPAQPGPNYGCLATVPNPAWYFLQVNNPGSLNILIQGQIGSPPVPGTDVDFICWGPFSSLANVCNSLTAANQVPVNLPTSNGCSYSGSPTETLIIPNGLTGQYYMVLITNFSNQTQNIAFTQIGGTGNTNCNLLLNKTICAGNSFTITAANTTSLSNPSYSLQPSGITNNTGSFVVSPLTTTSYTAFLTGTNASNAVVTQTSVTNLTVNPQPSASPTATQTTCTGTVNALNLGLSFNPTNATPTYTIAWTPTPFGIASPTQVSTTGGIAPGNYTAVITAQGGCSATAVVTISPPPAPAIFGLIPVGPVYSITCIEPTVVVNASEASYTYTWTNINSVPLNGLNASFTATNLGSWTITATNPTTGCTSRKTFSVVLNNSAPLSVVAPINQSITCGPGVVATATGTALNPTINVTHSWIAPGVPAPYTSGGAVSIYNPIVGTSTYILTNNINGCSTTRTIQVVSTAGNYPSFGVTSAANFTLGCSTKSVGDINIVGANTSPPGGVVSYTLLPPSYTGTNYATSQIVPSYTVNVPGTYSVIVRDNGNQCETRLLLSILQNNFGPLISTSVETQTLSCYTPSVTLRGRSGTQNVSYTWRKTVQPSLVVDSLLPVITTPAGASVPSATLIDTYTLTILDAGNLCTSSTLVTLYQNTRPPKPAIALSFTALTCSIYSINATNNSTTGVLPGTFFGTGNLNAILWQGPSPQNDLTNSSTYLGFTPGAYTMTVRDMNNGCTSVTTALLGDNRIYPVINTNTLVALDCGAGNSGVKLAAQALNLNPSDVKAQWFPPNNPTPGVTGLNSLTLTTDGVGVYKLIVTTNTNSCSNSVNVFVVNGVLTANFTADQTSGFAPLTVNFTNNSASSSSVTGTSSITSVWSFGNGATKTTTAITTSAGTSAVYTQPGTYTVTMYATKGTCIDTFAKVIRVDIPSKLEIPNVFTPNGDNVNDIFFVKAANLTSITALIYDRWGTKIYELSTDKGNIAWDGKTQTGREAPDGTYFYVITAKGKDGLSYDTKGTVSLFR